MLKKDLNVNIDLLISKISAEKQNQQNMVDKKEIELSELKIQEMRGLLNSLMKNVNELNDRVSTIENKINTPKDNLVYNPNEKHLEANAISVDKPKSIFPTSSSREESDEFILNKKEYENEINRINEFLITCSNYNKKFKNRLLKGFFCTFPNVTFGMILTIPLFIILSFQIELFKNITLCSLFMIVSSIILVFLEEAFKYIRKDYVNKEFSKVRGLFKNIVDETYVKKNDLIIPVKNVDFKEDKDGNIIISMKEVKRFFTRLY